MSKNTQSNRSRNNEPGDLVSVRQHNSNGHDSLAERTLLRLSIREIESYEKNPRRQKNPNYNKIKESIANDGLNQPLVVTHRPDHDHYVIYKGGNTRLKAITELYEESGDYRFRFVDCCFIPWSGFESDAIIGHLQENEMRKSLCFIDKALGVRSAIDYLQSESDGDQELTIRDAHAKLSEKGFSITLSTLSVMLYAAETVEPHLSPEICLKMGRPQMQKLRKLQKVFKSVCQEFDKSAEDANEIFTQTLQTYTESDWNFKVYRRCLEASLSGQVATSIQDIALRLDGYLNLSWEPLNDSYEKVRASLAEQEQRQKSDPNHTKLAREEVIPEIDCQVSNQYQEQSGGSSNSKAQHLQPTGSQEFQTTKQPHPRAVLKTPSNESSQISEVDVELRTLRQKALAIATRIAKRHDFYSNPKTKRLIIAQTGDWGIGYLVTDYPPLVERLNTSEIATRDVLWWQLMEFSDLQWATECARPMTAKLVSGSDLIHFVKSGNPKTIMAYAKGRMKCTVPHVGLISFGLRQLDDNSWSDLCEMMHTYRDIHQLANRNNMHLFSTSQKEGFDYDYQ